MGIGSSRACVRSSSTCVSAYSGEIVGKGRIARKNSVVSENHYFAVFGI